MIFVAVYNDGFLSCDTVMCLYLMHNRHDFILVEHHIACVIDRVSNMCTTTPCILDVLFWLTVVVLSIHAGFYLLARFVAIADKRVYSVTRYVISGHSLEHLCLAMVPMMLTLMLWFRNIKIARYVLQKTPESGLNGWVIILLSTL